MPGQALRTAMAQTLVRTREDAGSVDEGHSRQTPSTEEGALGAAHGRGGAQLAPPAQTKFGQVGAQ